MGRDRDRKAAEMIAALLLKWKEILTGLCKIRCCCPWRAPKAPPSPHRGKTLWQQLGSGERFLTGYLSPQLSEEMSFSPLCSSAASFLQHFVLLSTRKPFCLIALFHDSEVGVLRRTRLPMHDLMFPERWCCPAAVLLDVNIHKPERNIAHRKS